MGKGGSKYTRHIVPGGEANDTSFPDGKPLLKISTDFLTG